MISFKLGSWLLLLFTFIENEINMLTRLLHWIFRWLKCIEWIIFLQTFKGFLLGICLASLSMGFIWFFYTTPFFSSKWFYSFRFFYKVFSEVVIVNSLYFFFIVWYNLLKFLYSFFKKYIYWSRRDNRLWF